MKLYENREDDLYGEPLLPDFFFVQSSSVSAINSFITVQGNYGQVPTSTKSNLSARTFSITGNVESEKSEDVEKMRSFLFSKMYNKILWLKVYDDDDRLFKVVLDGQINITYNQGYNISRVFTFSFTLKAFEGVSWGDKKVKIAKNINIKNNNEPFFLDIDYKGDISVIPDICLIIFSTDVDKNIKDIIPFSIVSKKTFIKCDTRKVVFFKDVKVTNEFHLYNGAPFVKDELVQSINGESLARPLILKPGDNKIEFNPKAIKINYDIPPEYLTFMSVEVSFRECFL